MNHIMIDPASLNMSGCQLVDPSILALLKLKQISLKLQIFDSATPEDEKKPVLVFIHGNSSSKRVFDFQVSYYQEKYRVIAIDLIGHGQSTKFSECPQLSEDEKEQLSQAFYTLPAMIGQVAQALQKLHIEGAHLIGWSLGGHIAYGLAIEYPALVSSIVSIGSPPVKFSAEGLRLGFSEWFVNTLIPQWVEHPTPISATEAFSIAQNIGFNERDAFFTEDLMTTDPLVRKHLFLNIANYAHVKYDRTAVDGAYFARTTDIPLCLLVGNQDSGINYQFMAHLTEQLNHTHSLVRIIPQAQHAVFKTNPDEYHHTVDAFLENITEPSMQLRPF